MPRHNSILDQSYWFEINIVTASTCFISTAFILLDFIVLFGKSSVVTIRFFLKNYLANFLTRVIGFLVIYMIWTKILEYNHPMPWWGLILYFPNKIVSVISVLLMLPREFSFEEDTKKKLKNFVWFEFGWILAGIIKTLLGTSFEKLRNTDAQCLMALMFLMSKKFVSFFLSKLMNRIVGSDNERANCNLTTHINLSYGVFIATCCIRARPATVVCLVAVDALMQLMMTYKIVKMHKNTTVDENGISNKQRQKALLKLVLAELCEGLVPLAYAVSFAMAYYGPNMELLGFGKNNLWPVKVVVDVSWTFQVMLGLFFIDIASLSLNSSIIWIFCKVNLVKELCSALQKYWYILAVKLANDVLLHLSALDVNFGNDLSGQFVWIENGKNVSLY